MSRLVKIVDNKYVQIEEYRNPNICFNTNEYDNFENYCILRKTFDPFKMFYENQQLKKKLEEINKMIEKCGFVNIEQVMLSYCGLITQQKEFIKYLEDEKDRLARENSNIYEDSLGKTRLVNEDIFNKINLILQKYREIIGGKNE